MRRGGENKGDEIKNDKIKKVRRMNSSSERLMG